MEPLPPAKAEVKAPDLLSSLPAHLLDEILKRLNLRDAVRTSVLSSAWRHRWESLPGLALCFPQDTHPSVISRVLLRYTPSISRFAAYAKDDNVDDWVIALSHRSVQSIDLSIEWRFNNVELLTLHSSIFSCDRLVSLKLRRCNIPPLPRSGFTGFPVLQELYLSTIGFTDERERVLQAIIRGSPLLRVLDLSAVWIPVDCVIEAPNLQTLVLESDYDDGWQFGRLPRLQYADIDVPEYNHGGHHLLDFFAGVSQVQELKFYSPGNQHQVKIDKIPFTFHNLKSLEISTLFGYKEPIQILFSLLRSSPNLEELKIEIRDAEPDEWDTNSDEWDTNSDTSSEELTDPQWTDGMCANLQVVHIRGYDGRFSLPNGRFPLPFMKLILSKASLLCTLSVDVCCPISQDDPLNELLNCRRASTQAQVLFKEDLEQ